MTMGMKQVLRKIVPIAVIRKLKIHRDRRNLRAISRRECDVSRLRSLSNVNLPKLFASSELAAKWHEQLGRIERLGLPSAAGGVNPGDRRAVSYLIGGLRPAAVLEVGTHIGASTVHIAAAMQSNESTNALRPKLTSVDIADVNDPATKPWLRLGSRQSPREMIAELGSEDIVEFIAQASIDYLSNCGRKFDFIFLDGSHAAEVVYQEVPLALKALNDNGVILLHDYYPQLRPLWSNGNVIGGPYLATERIRDEGAKLTALPLGSLPWPTKLGSNTTSLALLLQL